MSESLLRAFFEQHPHAVLVMDSTGQVSQANAAAAWLGVDGRYPSFAELTGLEWPRVGDSEHEALPNWTRRLRVRAADGSVRPMDTSLFASASEGAQAPWFYFVLRDVTAAVQATRVWHEAESRSKVTTDSAPVLVWMAGTDGRRDWFNLSWLKFRGRTLGDELGPGWFEGVHPQDLERCSGIYNSSFGEHVPFTMDYRLLRHDGEYRWVVDTAVPRHDEDGAFIGYIGTCLDITERKNLEDKLAEHARTLRMTDRRREDFLAKLAHELRNPLAPIANAAAILRRMERGNRNLVMVREIIDRQVNQLRRLITDLVDVTRITRGKVVLQRAPVDLQSLVDRAVDDARPEFEQRHQNLRVARPPAGWSCNGDAQRLLQALSALLDNAAKFSPDGSTILVSAERTRDDVAITVRDEGRGIAPEFLPHVFELFVQDEQSLARDDGGLGVGLTIAKHLAELHGGSLEVKSAGLGLGTEATLRIALRAASEANATDPNDLAAVTGQRVLIIEDNDDARESLRLFVELNGNDVRTAANAAEGLDIAALFSPELVVCDIGLPGVDGFELVQQLRDRLAGQNTRFIALTGYGRPEDRDRALDSGFDAFLVKPFQATFSGPLDSR